MKDLSNPIFHNEDAAREYLEKTRWPDGVVCPFCEKPDNVKTLHGKSMGPGWYHCKECRKKFTVRVGTLYERSHVPIHKWLMATRLLVSSKKGMSAHQLHRTLGVTYKTAWFMCHRIREAMQDDGSSMGGEGVKVEADETFITPKTKDTDFYFANNIGWVSPNKYEKSRKILSLVERGGRARSIHMQKLNANDVREKLVTNVDRKSDLNTDESNFYKKVGLEYASHGTVVHSKKEYGRGDIHTNTIEGYFSIFKRGMVGIYQHCGEQHLFRYLREFDFRYSHRHVDDSERAQIALKNIEGKRLTYRRAHEAANA